MLRNCLLILALFSFYLVIAQPVAAQKPATKQTIVTAAQVNGTWESKTGTFKILALGNQQLKVEFQGFYEYKTEYGPMANIGEGRGIAFIEGDTAIFQPEDADENDQITLKFTKGKLIVTQEGTCGFGLNVTAAGTYRKASRQKPSFQNE
ncbi:MAG: hypothetical protein HY774_12550 [Acidobacteria bacterium]|nr:hypothetical protein [Acidobacteriota bacterium]